MGGRLRRALPWGTWWAVMAGSFAAAAWWSGGDALGPGVVTAVTLGNTALVAGLEQLLPRDRRSNLLRDRQSWNDMGHGALFSFLGRPVAAAACLAVVGAAAALWSGVGTLWPREAPLLAQLPLALLLWGLLAYAFHRALHSFDALWAFHAIHHDTRQMHLLKSGRIHFGEEALQFLLVPLPLLLLGCPGEVLLWVGLWTVAEGNLAHSNLDQRFPSWMHYVVPTAQLHVVHHAEPRALHDSNYGGVTPLYDLLFGTDRHPVPATGIEGDPVPPGFVAQLLYPFRPLWQRRAGGVPATDA